MKDLSSFVADHAHCDHCITPIKCVAVAALGSCKVIKCDCDVFLHSCKQEDHSLICSAARVPCTNAGYGCPATMLRRFLGSHLGHCPASVVCCQMEWNRWVAKTIPASIKSLEPFETKLRELLYDSRMPLDVSLALRDRRMLNKFISAAEKDRWKFCNSYGNGTLSKTASDREMTLEYCDDCHYCKYSIMDRHCFQPGHTNAYLSGWGYLPQISCRGKSILPAAEVIGLDLQLEYATRYQGKLGQMYTFFCGQEFRRDEYSFHSQNVHADIHSGLNGWMEQRCPLAQYGCPYVRRHFVPDAPNTEVFFSSMLDSFGITSQQKAIPHDESAGSTFFLAQLPVELLTYIASFLDSFSLCNLALTSKFFRDICYSLRFQHGMVLQQWEKESGCNAWRVTRNRWVYSKSFSPIRRWKMSNEPPMSEHMRQCKVFHEQRLLQKSSVKVMPWLKLGFYGKDAMEDA